MKKSASSGALRRGGSRKQPAAESDVLESAVWLRRQLSGELDCHLGEGRLCDLSRLSEVVDRMVKEGAVVRLADARDKRPLLAIAPPSSSQSAALLAGWLLAPLCAMHAGVLSGAVGALRERPGMEMPMGDLRREVKAMAAKGSGAVPVDSVVMAEYAFKSLCDNGVFVEPSGVDEERGSSEKDSEEGSPAKGSVAGSSSPLPEAVTAGPELASADGAERMALKLMSFAVWA